MATIRRELASVQKPASHQGFLGPDHTARAVIQDEFQHSDPFILLMDDMLDFQGGEPIGGPHPHAGFETVTLVAEGRMGDGPHAMKAGDFEMMTAGSGVIHTETIDTKTKVRILQLWLTLPGKDRWTTPRVQHLPFEHVPRKTENGVEIRLYSGSLAGMTAPTLNHVPVVIADVHLHGTAQTTVHIPASFNAFLYVLNGRIEVGEDGLYLREGEIGWLDRTDTDADSELLFTGESGSRFVLYAGPPQRDSIVSYGPFIGSVREDIPRLFQEYRQGRMKHITTVPDEQKIAL